MNWLHNLFSGGSSSESVEWNKDALILDVRTTSEFASGHVDGSVNAPVDTFAQNHVKVAPDKSRQIIVYCQSGARSGQAMRYLQQQGYANVINAGSASAVVAKTKRSLVR
jgi:phage shock protein E